MTLPTMRMGDIEIKVLSDGVLRTSIDFVIGMERAQAEDLVGGTDGGSLFIPVNVFLVVRDDKRVLIDAGAGNTMQPTLGKLPSNLRSAGFDPRSITHIVITHIHPDHANGLVDDAGQPHYPNAEILIHEQEADFWLRPASGSAPERVMRNRERAQINLAPYMNRLRRLRDGEEVLGFSPILAPGHSPGHTCWRFGSGSKQMIAWGDLVHFSAIQISHPDTALTYDLDPVRASESRKRILDMVSAEGWAVAGAHVNAPGLGYVVRKGSGYRFEPAA